MSHAVVTLELDAKKSIDLALPLNIPSQALSPAIANALDLDDSGSGIYLLSLKTDEGIVRLSPNATLAEAGVLDGSILLIQRREGPASPGPTSPSRASVRMETGESFELDSARTLIGRKDVKRGILADIDLTPFDPRKITSRPHAAIEQDQGEFFLVDQGSANGTWVNGESLTPRKPFKLHDGDQIVLGRNGVTMIFVRH